MGSIYENATEVIRLLSPLHSDLYSFYWIHRKVIWKLSKLIVEGKRLFEERSRWMIRDMFKIDKAFFEAGLFGEVCFYSSFRWF
jgi:hypothetical protein